VKLRVILENKTMIEYKQGQVPFERVQEYRLSDTLENLLGKVKIAANEKAVIPPEVTTALTIFSNQSHHFYSDLSMLHTLGEMNIQQIESFIGIGKKRAMHLYQLYAINSHFVVSYSQNITSSLSHNQSFDALLKRYIRLGYSFHVSLSVNDYMKLGENVYYLKDIDSLIFEYYDDEKNEVIMVFDYFGFENKWVAPKSDFSPLLNYLLSQRIRKRRSIKLK
jgi:hypothetical protein